jgi:hypothetical protein
MEDEDSFLSKISRRAEYDPDKGLKNQPPAVSSLVVLSRAEPRPPLPVTTRQKPKVVCPMNRYTHLVSSLRLSQK